MRTSSLIFFILIFDLSHIFQSVLYPESEILKEHYITVNHGSAKAGDQCALHDLSIAVSQ